MRARFKSRTNRVKHKCAATAACKNHPRSGFPTDVAGSNTPSTLPLCRRPLSLALVMPPVPMTALCVHKGRQSAMSLHAPAHPSTYTSKPRRLQNPVLVVRSLHCGRVVLRVCQTAYLIARDSTRGCFLVRSPPTSLMLRTQAAVNVSNCATVYEKPRSTSDPLQQNCCFACQQMMCLGSATVFLMFRCTQTAHDKTRTLAMQDKFLKTRSMGFPKSAESATVAYATTKAAGECAAPS